MQLYSRVRPTKLDQVLGNTGVVRSIAGMFKNRHFIDMQKAFIFVGPSGVGKTTVARIMCDMAGCEKEDIWEVNAADVNGVDAMRTLIERCKFRPRGGTRIIILDEAHRLTTEAQNALLKLLEDGPEGTLFILSTTELGKIIKTVLTRCAVMQFNSLSDSELRSLLDRTCVQEGMDVSEHIREGILEIANGSARASLVALEAVAQAEDEEDALSILVAQGAVAEPKEVRELARAFINMPGGLQKAQTIFKMYSELDRPDPESIRMMLAGFVRTSLLNRPRPALGSMLDVLTEVDFLPSGKRGENKLVSMMWMCCQF
jgi:DNA polymerase III gamma/tau subunit